MLFNYILLLKINIKYDQRVTVSANGFVLKTPLEDNPFFMGHIKKFLPEFSLDFLMICMLLLLWLLPLLLPLFPPLCTPSFFR